MPKKFIFPITTGRSGTVFLTELMKLNAPEAETHHERVGFQTLGLDTPDASHFTLFNSVGNVQRVQDYWKMKCDRVLASKAETYAEISHFLFKAGLIENIAPLAEAGDVQLVLLTRDPFKIQWSYVNRFEFSNFGYTWLFALDPRYPNVMVKSAPFMEHGVAGAALWYVHEVFARQEYYARLVADMPNVHIHRVDLSEITTPEGAAKLLTALGETTTTDTLKMPPRQNATKQMHFGEDMKNHCKRLAAGAPLKSREISDRYFDSGRRLAQGAKRKRNLARPNA
ncbi:MAG: hypothetical protein ACRBCL_05705 [Maritimibacter sp.]